MKKTLTISIAVLAILLGIYSCEEVRITLPEDQFYVAFDYKVNNIIVDSSKIFHGSDNTLMIPVLVAAKKGGPVTVEFEFDTTDLNGFFWADPAHNQSYAEENVNFTLVNSSKILNFPDGVGYDTIKIQPIDVAFTGFKYVFINLTSNSAGYRIGFREGANADTIVRASHRIRIY